MAWIEVHDTLREHHKTYALASLLKLEQFAAVGLMVSLWTWAINHAQDGDLSKFPPAAIASACHWKKKPEVLLDALMECGFVTVTMQIHDWDVYAGKLIDRREANARRNRDARAAKASRDDDRAHHERITSASRDGATVPNPTVPNLTVPNHRENPPKPPKGADPLFDQFWAAYPKKVAKEAARKAFDKLKPDDDLLGAMLKAIEQHKRSDQWAKDGGQFIPNPTTWLNQKRWQDELEVRHGLDRANQSDRGVYAYPSEAI